MNITLQERIHCYWWERGTVIFKTNRNSLWADWSSKMHKMVWTSGKAGSSEQDRGWLYHGSVTYKDKSEVMLKNDSWKECWELWRWKGLWAKKIDPSCLKFYVGGFFFLQSKGANSLFIVVVFLNNIQNTHFNRKFNVFRVASLCNHYHKQF